VSSALEFWIGTASQTDPTLVNSDLFYPSSVRSAEERLLFHAERSLRIPLSELGSQPHEVIAIRSATDISHIAERGVIKYEAEIYDFHRDTTEDRCNRRIAA
jgi:hypothetical protein